MHAGHYDNLIFNNAVEKTVWETMEKCATSLAMDNRKLQRVRQHRFHDRVRRCKKLITQTDLLTLVPAISVFNIRGGRRANNRWLHRGRVRICWRTSSQGMPLGPERSRSSNRLSNSPRCASLRGIASGDLLRLSQSSSINRNRSSGLRLSMFSAGLLIAGVCHLRYLPATPRDTTHV